MRRVAETAVSARDAKEKVGDTTNNVSRAPKTDCRLQRKGMPKLLHACRLRFYMIGIRLNSEPSDLIHSVECDGKVFLPLEDVLPPRRSERYA